MSNSPLLPAHPWAAFPPTTSGTPLFPILDTLPSVDINILIQELGGANGLAIFAELKNSADNLRRLDAESTANHITLATKQSELEDAIEAYATADNERKEAIAAYATADNERTCLQNLLSKTSNSSNQRSPPHPDPDKYDGKDSSRLSTFLEDITIKLVTNSDWYFSEAAKIVYFIKCLEDRARDQFRGYIKNDTVDFPLLSTAVEHLKLAFG